MEYIHAAMLIWYATKDKTKITRDAILATLKGAGIEGDPAKAEMVATALQGIDIEEVLKAPILPIAAPTAAPPVEAKKEEEKKKEEEEKKAEEEAVAGLAGLFE